jgi:anthranilate phosphoribosyltransferase
MSHYAPALKHLLIGQDLDEDTAGHLLEELLGGALGPGRSAAALTALAAKGENAIEIAAFAQAIRRHARSVRATGLVFDSSGTGGSGLTTLNVSTLVAFTCAAAGVRVAKLSHRANSGACGSLDVLEHLGVHTDLTSAQIERLLGELGVAILDARVHHPQLLPLATLRKSLGFRTILDLVAPLCNPAGPTHQLIGVPDQRLGPLMIGALRRMGVKRAMVVAGEEGMDEISMATGTRYWELYDNGTTDEGLMLPEDFGLKRAPFGQMAGGTVARNAEGFLALLRGEDVGPRRDLVLLNAGAALYVAGRAGDIEEGVDKARELIKRGEVQRLFLRYRSQTAALSEGV